MSVQEWIVAERASCQAIWCYIEEADFCVCVPNKNGGTSYRKAFADKSSWESSKLVPFMMEFYAKGHGPFSAKELMFRFPDKPHYLVVRHPVDRFGSLWRNKCRDRLGSPYAIHGMNPDQLIGFIEENPEYDRHVLRQSDYLTEKTYPIILSDLMSILELLPERINRSVPTPSDPQMPKKRILKHYAKDYELWSRTQDDIRLQMP